MGTYTTLSVYDGSSASAVKLFGYGNTVLIPPLVVSTGRSLFITVTTSYYDATGAGGTGGGRADGVVIL